VLFLFFWGVLMREAVQLDWKPERPLLLTQQQVALWLNVSERTIRNLIRKRKLIPKFIGRRCLIPTAAVERFARQVAGQ
jgi:excisionase family DNA binding protein